MSGRRGSDPVLVVGCAVAALVGGVVAVAVLGSARDIDRPGLVAALVVVAVLLAVLAAAFAPTGSGRALPGPSRSGAGTAAPGRRSGLAGTAPEGRGSAGTAPEGRGSAGTAPEGRSSAGTAPAGGRSGDSATGGRWWTDSESDGPGPARPVPDGRGSAGSGPVRPAGRPRDDRGADPAAPRRRTEPPEPDDGFSWAGRSAPGSPEPAGRARQWWTEPGAAAAAEPGPLVPALDLPEHPAETRIVQCTRCGDERVDVRHESAGGFAFDCGACGHHWSWQAGAPWPVAVVRPRLRRPAGPASR